MKKGSLTALNKYFYLRSALPITKHYIPTVHLFLQLFILPLTTHLCSTAANPLLTRILIASLLRQIIPPFIWNRVCWRSYFQSISFSTTAALIQLLFLLFNVSLYAWPCGLYTYVSGQCVLVLSFCCLHTYSACWLLLLPTCRKNYRNKCMYVFLSKQWTYDERNYIHFKAIKVEISIGFGCLLRVYCTFGMRAIRCESVHATQCCTWTKKKKQKKKVEKKLKERKQ